MDLHAPENTVMFAAQELQGIFDACAAAGWRSIAPTVRDGVVMLAEVQSVDALPLGLVDEQDAGYYRLRAASRPSYFGCTVSAQAWKSFLYPARQKIWSARRQGQAWVYDTEMAEQQRLALIGVRGCDLHALAIQKEVREKHAIDAAPAPLIVTVDCARAVATCFCTSMGTGPAGQGPGVDLRLAEVFLSDDEHIFVAQMVTKRGGDLLQQLHTKPCDSDTWQLVERQWQAAAAAQQRAMDTRDLPAIMVDRSEDPYWDEIAQRCLSCANCTMACPTCFCNTVEDSSDLNGEHSERWLRWDSCFNLDFSYVHPKSVRQSTKARYRQWLTHKLGHWVEQFGQSGCVGCGRCISWCPVGIDLTEAVAKLRATASERQSQEATIASHQTAVDPV